MSNPVLFSCQSHRHFLWSAWEEQHDMLCTSTEHCYSAGKAKFKVHLKWVMVLFSGHRAFWGLEDGCGYACDVRIKGFYVYSNNSTEALDRMG